MLDINGTEITVTKGDSAGFSVAVLCSDETPYTLGDGEYVRFLVRILPEHDPVIDKKLTVQAEDHTFYVWLTPEDTDLPRSSYVYEAKLYGADGGEITTFIGGGAEKPRFCVC